MENYRGLVLKSGPCFGIFPQKKKQNKKNTYTVEWACLAFTSVWIQNW